MLLLLLYGAIIIITGAIVITGAIIITGITQVHNKKNAYKRQAMCPVCILHAQSVWIYGYIQLEVMNISQQL